MTEAQVTRFWGKASRGDGCWLWRGQVDPKGYGEFRIGSGRKGAYRKVYLAHRKAYELAHGPIPAGLCVCHSCDVPACVNPAHLWVGTVAENNADMRAKGRAVVPTGGGCRMEHCPTTGRFLRKLV